MPQQHGALSPTLLASPCDEPPWPGSDHSPQLCELPFLSADPLLRGFAWSRMDAARASELANAVITVPPLATSPAQLEGQALDLVTQVDAIARDTTPPKGSSRGNRSLGWNAETAQATKLLQEAEQEFRRDPLNHDAALKVKGARYVQRRAIRTANRAHWRRLLETVCNRDTDIWRLEKRARQRSHIPSTLPKLSPLQTR